MWIFCLFFLQFATQTPLKGTKWFSKCLKGYVYTLDTLDVLYNINLVKLAETNPHPKPLIWGWGGGGDDKIMQNDFAGKSRGMRSSPISAENLFLS